VLSLGGLESAGLLWLLTHSFSSSIVLKNPETNPYPHKFQVDYDDHKFHEEFAHLKSGDVVKDKEIRIAARIYNKRSSGAKLIFYGTYGQYYAVKHCDNY